MRSAVLETMQVVFGQLPTVVCAGVVFARVSHPRRRARSVFVSEAACVARREVGGGGNEGDREGGEEEDVEREKESEELRGVEVFFRFF